MISYQFLMISKNEGKVSFDIDSTYSILKAHPSNLPEKNFFS